MSIADNLTIVREKIDTAAEKASVDGNEIRLIAVTKTVGADMVAEAIRCGVTDIGENYVQEAVSKHSIIDDRVRWHMIGHLQTNKVKQCLPIFDMLQSVDSIALAQEISKRSVTAAKVTDILVEVNISGESSKTGVSPWDAEPLCAAIEDMPGIRLCGLMGIGPLTDDQNAIRKSFAQLRNMWEKLPENHRIWLSMGMTSDFEIAIEEGSNMVRIGTAIFGARSYNNR